MGNVCRREKIELEATRPKPLKAGSKVSKKELKACRSDNRLRLIKGCFQLEVSKVRLNQTTCSLRHHLDTFGAEDFKLMLESEGNM